MLLCVASIRVTEICKNTIFCLSWISDYTVYPHVFFCHHASPVRMCLCISLASFLCTVLHAADQHTPSENVKVDIFRH
jgi:hypothetical protein